MTCLNGHETVTCLQEQHFEVLFELGANAIIDAYYREAVSSFTSSLERFYEFYIKAISTSKEIDFDKTWNEIKNQSERQLGAFAFVYLLENKTKPPMQSDNERGFRNNVTHKGYIPTREEAIEYGQSVLDIITPILFDLKERHGKAVNIIVKNHVIETFTKAKSLNINHNISNMTIPTTISIARANTEIQPTLNQTLEHLKKSRFRG